MRARRDHLGIALASLATLLATVFVVQTRGDSPLSLLLFAGALVCVLALEVGLRAAPIVVGVVFLLFGGLLWLSGGLYAILCGLLLLGSAAVRPEAVPETDRARPS